jgi:zeta-carotene desaturase
MRTVIIVGGGLAGLSAAAALSQAGFRVRLFEARGFLGGRATSYPVPASEDGAEVIDNCQHVLLGCCVNLLDFYRRLGVAEAIGFHREFYFIEPGGRVSTLARGVLPAPLHFTGSFLRLAFLSAADKFAIARGMLAIRRERGRRADLASISMLDWLREKRQTQPAIDRFWRQVLVSAINEELDRMAAIHGFQVFDLAFLSRADFCRMGVPTVPLGELYRSGAWERFGNVTLSLRSPAEDFDPQTGVFAGGARHAADHYIFAIPFERIATAAPSLGIDAGLFEHSPITGIHLWFDRPVTRLPHATLLDRNIQWMFNKKDGRYLQLVVSASRQLTEMPRADVIAAAVRELGEFLPAAREAKLERAHVVKELRATFSAAPGTEARRPRAETRFPNVFLAGDWTGSGWPATMEGAVRSGYIAAEAVARAAGLDSRFLLPDLR